MIAHIGTIEIEIHLNMAKRRSSRLRVWAGIVLIKIAERILNVGK